MKMNKNSPVVFVAVFVLAIILVAYIVPQFLISDGTEQFQGIDKQRAKQSLEIIQGVDYINVSTKLKVIKVEPYQPCQYQAIIQSYGLFGRKMDLWMVTPCGMHSIQASDIDSSPWVIYVPKENRDSSSTNDKHIPCLKKIGTEYKFDESGNLLIRADQARKVTFSCS